MNSSQLMMLFKKLTASLLCAATMLSNACYAEGLHEIYRATTKEVFPGGSSHIIESEVLQGERTTHISLHQNHVETDNFTLQTAWKQPTLFQGYIALNTANFKSEEYADESLLEKLLSTAKNKPHNKCFISVPMTKEGVDRHPHILSDYKWPEQQLNEKNETGLSLQRNVLSDSALQYQDKVQLLAQQNKIYRVNFYE